MMNHKNHKLDMIKLNDFKATVLPLTRKLIEDQVAYYGLRSTIDDLEQEKEKICAQLEAIEMFPAIARTHSAKDPELKAKLAYFEGLKASLEAELSDCNQKLKIHKIQAEELEEVVDYKVYTLTGLLAAIFNDEDGFLEPDDIVKLKGYLYELLYISCFYNNVNNVFSVQARSTFSEMFPGKEAPAYSISEFFKVIYELDINKL